MNDKNCQRCGSPMRRFLADGDSYYWFCVECKAMIPDDDNKKQGVFKQAMVRLLLPVVRRLSKK